MTTAEIKIQRSILDYMIVNMKHDNHTGMVVDYIVEWQRELQNTTRVSIDGICVVTIVGCRYDWAAWVSSDVVWLLLHFIETLAMDHAHDSAWQMNNERTAIMDKATQ